MTLDAPRDPDLPSTREASREAVIERATWREKIGLVFDVLRTGFHYAEAMRRAKSPPRRRAVGSSVR